MQKILQDENQELKAQINQISEKHKNSILIQEEEINKLTVLIQKTKAGFDQKTDDYRK